MPNTRITKTIVNAKIRNESPNVRVSSFQTGILVQGPLIPAGSPIGLLLALTYAQDTQVASTFRGDYRPNVRIRTD